MLPWNFSPHNSTFIFWPGTYPSQSNLITFHAKQISNLGFQLHEFHQAFFTIWKVLNFLFQTFLCFLLCAISDFSNPPELFSQFRNQFHTIYHVVFSFIITFCLLKPGKKYQGSWNHTRNLWSSQLNAIWMIFVLHYSYSDSLMAKGHFLPYDDYRFTFVF